MSLSCLVWVGWEGFWVSEVRGGGVVGAEGPGGLGQCPGGRPAQLRSLQRAPGTGRLKTQLKTALIEPFLGYGQHRRLRLAGHSHPACSGRVGTGTCGFWGSLARGGGGWDLEPGSEFWGG